MIFLKSYRYIKTKIYYIILRVTYYYASHNGASNVISMKHLNLISFKYQGLSLETQYVFIILMDKCKCMQVHCRYTLFCHLQYDHQSSCSAQGTFFFSIIIILHVFIYLSVIKKYYTTNYNNRSYHPTEYLPMQVGMYSKSKRMKIIWTLHNFYLRCNGVRWWIY